MKREPRNSQTITYLQFSPNTDVISIDHDHLAKSNLFTGQT
jgi:hypothetical protein